MTRATSGMPPDPSTSSTVEWSRSGSSPPSADQPVPLAIDPLIRLRGISKIFHTDEMETHALSRIDLDVRAGEYLAITGPSGCGKTTLLSLLGLLDSPSE